MSIVTTRGHGRGPVKQGLQVAGNIAFLKMVQTASMRSLPGRNTRSTHLQIQLVAHKQHSVAQRFGLPTEQWLKMLESERDISPAHYRDEIIWPTIAIRRLARQQLEVTQEEIDRELESQFGPQVRARLIVLRDAQTARQVHQLATKNPDDFGINCQI